MRLTPQQRHCITQAAAAHFGADAVVRLFGSRTDDRARGGDIDLLIDTTLSDPAAVAAAHTRFLAQLYATLGEQKLDVLIDYPGRRAHPPIFEWARREGIVL